MSNEELVAGIQQGRSGLMEQLWERVKAFVYWKSRSAMARIPPGRGCTLEDLQQSGYIALASAVETYDPGKGAFLTWLGYYLKTEFALVGGYHGTKRNPLDDAVSLDAPLGSGDEEEGGTLYDIVSSERADGGDAYADLEEAIYREQLHAVLDSAMDRLAPDQAEVLRGRYWQGKESEELAREQGITVTQLHKRERAGIQALRSPTVSHELRRFLDDHTDYYAGGSLGRFLAEGSSSVERAVVRREELEHRWRESQSRKETA